MHLKMANQTVALSFSVTGQHVSPHTGATLREGQAILRIQGQNAEATIGGAIDGARTKGQPLDEVNDTGEVVARWRVAGHNYSYTDHGPSTVYNHSLELQEHEPLEIQELIVDGLSLSPYQYREEIDHERLLINARVELHEPEVSKLEQKIKAGGYFAVVRRGISDVPREMRFGMPILSRHGQVTKHALVLVEKPLTGEDSGYASVILPPQWVNSLKAIPRQIALFEELAGTLQEKGIISSEELDEVRRRAKERAPDAWLELGQVDDIDVDHPWS